MANDPANEPPIPRQRPAPPPPPQTPADFTNTPMFFIIVGIMLCAIVVGVFWLGMVWERKAWNDDCGAMGMRHTDRVYICVKKEQ